VPSEPRRAAIVGCGLIGGSVGLALRSRGWHVTGVDVDESRAARAFELGAVDAVGVDSAAELTFVATAVGQVPAAARQALATGPGVVTDVGSVKSSIVADVDDPRFVGGHPMAGSEQEGVDGARADLFEGAVWVLTPGARTDDDAYAAVHAAVSSLGAEVVSLPPDRHDRLVAVVSHVPHLAAATLMRLADERADEHRALLRLAAGGFRDMTRIASGAPDIWPDICGENREAILDVLDILIADLQHMRQVVGSDDRGGLLQVLEQAREARVNLPVRGGPDVPMVEVRIPVPDRPGAIAGIMTLAAELGVNVSDLEVAHSGEGGGGVLILVLEEEAAPSLRDALLADGIRSSSLPVPLP
jgi:prephenate dehydrogenase